MEKKEKRIPSLKRLVIYYSSFFAAAILAIVITISIFASVEFKNISYKTANIIETCIIAAILILVAVMLVLTVLKVYKVCYKGFYLTSKSIIDDIGANKQKFARYEDDLASELGEMNKSVVAAEKFLNNSIVFSKYIDYSSLNLEYSSKELEIISYPSFSEKITEIVLLSQAYRNAFLLISYGDNIEKLAGLNKADFVKKIHNIFSYDNILIADAEDESGFYIYIPQIDSHSRLKEEIEIFLKNSAMVKNTANGKTLVSPKVSIVMYPFSDIEDILKDLRFASRQNEQINFFLPDRLNKRDNKIIMHGSLAINSSNQLVSNLNALRTYYEKTSTIKAGIHKQLKSFAAFINADYAGIIMRDDNIGKFINYISINNIDMVMFEEGQVVSKNIMETAAEVVDEDRTYYYSNRTHLSPKLGRFLDKHHINSGFMFLIEDDKGPLSLIYFNNYERDLKLDSYLREAAAALSFHIGSIMRDTSNHLRLKEAENRTDILMKLSNYMLYSVDEKKLEIEYASETFEDKFGDCKGQKCYKAIYGLNKPCENCPLRSKKKMSSLINEEKFETSLVLKNENESSVRMLIQNVDKDAVDHNRFDSDLLINSYYALFDDLKNIYLSRGKGYLLLLSIENWQTLLKAYGNEGYFAHIRKFIETLNEKLPKKYHFYAYNSNIIGIILPNVGRSDIIDISERIYKVSKENFLDNEYDHFEPLILDYIAASYPQEYPLHTDFLRHTERVINGFPHEEHLDQILFVANKHYRSASRRQFINEVIDKSFKEKTFKVKLQPMINSASKEMMGAELLIRLSDDYQNESISAEEVIRVAAQEKKIGIISDALIEYIGELYQKYGLSVFRSRGFTRLSLNTDFSYFSDEDFLDRFASHIDKFYLPRNFLTFEIAEKELSEHYDFFKNNTFKMKQIGVHLVVDQFTGEYLTLQKIKTLGINEVKIPRSLVRDIDVNKINFKQISAIMKEANELGIRIAVVGVENKDQYFMIRDICKDAIMQGFYFYQPLEAGELIEALKIN